MIVSENKYSSIEIYYSEKYSKTTIRIIIILCVFIPYLYLISGCSSINENGELVRHHFGYIRFVTPANVAGKKPLQVLEVETFGAWLEIDKRITPERESSGAGIGYKFDRREIVPLSCKVVFRVKNKEQIELIIKMLKHSSTGEKGICIIRDSQK